MRNVLVMHWTETLNKVSQATIINLFTPLLEQCFFLQGDLIISTFLIYSSAF